MYAVANFPHFTWRQSGVLEAELLCGVQVLKEKRRVIWEELGGREGEGPRGPRDPVETRISGRRQQAWGSALILALLVVILYKLRNLSGPLLPLESSEDNMNFIDLL